MPELLWKRTKYGYQSNLVDTKGIRPMFTILSFRKKFDLIRGDNTICSNKSLAICRAIAELIK
jgi:hypothetical protein